MIQLDILIITLILILLDIVFGFAGAVKEKNVQSGMLRQGLWHKAGFIGLIILAYVIEITASYTDLGIEIPSVLAVCVYIILTECVSIFENLCVLNPKIVDSPLGSIFYHAHKIEEAEKLEDENA